MPFDTVGRHSKRIRNDFSYIFEELEEDNDTPPYQDASFFNTLNDSPYNKASIAENYNNFYSSSTSTATAATTAAATFNINNTFDSSPISLLQKSYGIKTPYNNNNNSTPINSINTLKIITTPPEEEDDDEEEEEEDKTTINMNSMNFFNNNNNNNSNNYNLIRSPSLSSCSSTLTSSSPSVPFSMSLCPPLSIPQSISPSPSSPIDLESLHTALSKFQLSYTESGIHMEANISNASELRSLLDAFKKLSCTTNNHLSTATTATYNMSHDDNSSHSSSSFFNDPFSLLSTSPIKQHFMDEEDNNDEQQQQQQKSRRNSVVIYRNKSCKSVPVNLFQLVGLLGQALHTTHHSNHYGGTLRQIADVCVETFFSCWIRYSPILNKQEFMTWYHQQANPQDTLVVNALCSLVFRHTVTHHGIPVLNHFLHNPDMVHEQEEFYFNRARDALSQSFDTPDRLTIIALAFLCCKTEPSRRLQYGGLAISLLQQLNIYPRMIISSGSTTSPNMNDDNDNDNNTNENNTNNNIDTLLFNNNTNTSINENNNNNMDDEEDNEEEEIGNDIAAYQLEMDTRLWWFVWQIDFSLWTAGLPKITPLLQYPNQRYDQVDVPRVLEHEIDDNEMSVHCFSNALKIWRTQGNIITTLYEQDSELTSEQLALFDQQLMTLYDELPLCFKFNTNDDDDDDDDDNNNIDDNQRTVPCTNLHQPLPSNFGIQQHDEQQQQRDIRFVKIRIKLEYNASRIILHRLFIPEVGDPRPSESSLQSLGICLHVALDQLEVLHMASRPELKCSLDRDELWRIGKLFSTALDIYRTVKDQHALRTIIGESITTTILEQGLEKAFEILKRTPENIVGTKSWIQLVDFIQMEIKRHQLYSRSSSSSSATTASVKNNKNNKSKNNIESKKNGKQIVSSSPSSSSSNPPLSIITFDTPHINNNTKNNSPISSSSSSTSKKSSSSTMNHSKQFTQTFVQATGPFEQKNQPRFRYFNPRKMNKFLFIDESR
ncbi:hypothetical protein BJ944DRAFT_269841 [Cunninghamella echinulata]|nr:hypothetical protein BJ944DRAFT_269841 [Cunninghamella echinulata]